MVHWQWYLCPFIVAIFLQFDVFHSQNLTCNPNDLRALLGFFDALSSGVPGWPGRSSTDCCRWDGVVCEENNDGRVVRLELAGQSLKGSISESLSGLDQLKMLNLSLNLLEGNLPSKFFHMDKLEAIDLSSNYLTGSIPLNNSLPSLQVFNISGNLFAGVFPIMANSPRLESFTIQGNRFVGPLNKEICRFSPGITGLHLSDNNFSGILHAGIANCTNLRHLELDSNALFGNIPEELFGIVPLERLSLQKNMFYGRISERIGNLSNLLVVDLSYNEFFGRIPTEFGRMKRLKHFSAMSNALNGHLPSSLANVSTLELINLRKNSLDGEINLDCTAMIRLDSLDLGSNKFSGENLHKLSHCRKLKTLNLARNKLNGPVPDSFKELENLSYLSLTSCGLRNLSSALMALQHCKNLTTLVMTGNFQNEIMPIDGIEGFKMVKVLIVPNCELSGYIPPWLKTCTKLQLLDFSWNRLTGTIPSWIGDLDNLFYLDLLNNSLSGELPRSLTQLKSLISCNMSQHDLSSDVPFFAKQNQSLRGLEYKQLIGFRPTLDLCHNHFNGSIWPEFGNLKKLHALLLSRNNLSGSIPEQLSGMASIEVLVLSYNELSGTIPLSLTNLTFLSLFDVSHNNLTGPIPTLGQFSTFPISSFEGNIGLCGPHSTSCEFVVSQHKKNLTNRKATIIGVTVGIGLGAIAISFVVFLYISRLHERTADDTNRIELESGKRELELSGSKLVLLFHNKDNNEITVDDLLKSTNNFDQSNIIGCGGFGLVYKATLPDGTKVAVKRLSGDCGQMEREFQAEVDALSKAQHRNLVLLQGYCRYGSDRLLIYSYMEKGSLDYWLHERVDGGFMLDWTERLSIARGAARGLEYLHQSCEPHIVHRDIKSSNILLDENFEAHLADFGLARLMLPYDTHVTTDLVGTLGYIPPEYGQASIATFKGDVYSFGVVLLELLTGKRPIDICKPKGFKDLISWVLQIRKEKRETEVFDPVIYEKEKDKQMLQVLEIACLCLNETPKLRPSVQQIVLWLNNITVDA